MMFWIFIFCLACAVFGWKKEIGSVIVVATFLSGVMLIANAVTFEKLINTIPAEIEIKMLEQENTKIEKSIKQFVSEYMNFEKNIFDMKIELAFNFPEVKSNELMAKQINIFIDNRQKIIALKQSILYRKVYRIYLLFF